MAQSIAHYYHERTKYAPETIASKRSLDWDSQPVPFKDYKIGNTVDLKPYLSNQAELQRLSRLLFCSYGLTARLPTMGEVPIYLRAAPSAGGLYPAEVYLISRGTPLLQAGLYNYQPQSHSLVHFWENEVWSEVQSACFDHPALQTAQLALVTTAVFYRSAWRYEDRAYRRIFLDTGHLLGNIELTSAMNNYRPCLIGGFQDEEINQLLYLDPEQEGVITVIALIDLREESIPNGATALPSLVHNSYPDIPDGELLGYFHQATQIDAPLELSQEATVPLEDKYNFPFCLKISTATEAIDWKQLSGLEQTIVRRRSTRAYSGADLTLEELKLLLNFTYQPQDYVDQGLDGSPDYFNLDLIETFVAVSGVSNLEAGCYYYAPKAQELRQIRFKKLSTRAAFPLSGTGIG